MSYSSRLLQLLIPVSIFVAMLVATQFISMLTSIWQTLVLQSLPYVSLAAGFLLSFQFNRSRYIFALAFCAIAAYLATWDSYFTEQQKYTLLAVISLNLFLFSFSKDRSTFSIHGTLRVAFVAIQAAVALYLQQQFSAQFNEFWQMEVFRLPQTLDNYLDSPDILLIFIAALAVLHFVLEVVTDNDSHRAIFCCQIFMLIVANDYQHDVLIPLMLSATAIIVILTTILASHDMAYKDELTALPSRRALNQLLLSLGRKYTIAMMDIDHFKKFNDTHGHDVGDDVLRMVASKIGKVTGGGKAFRYGGEEFTVVFPKKTPDQAEPHLEALRQTIANYMMVPRVTKRAKKDKADKNVIAKRGKSKTKDGSLSVTISIGLAERSGESKTPEQVIKAADEALYRAKKAGRNCVRR
jgi:diguanylate cyclase (GGDEF)-like protein